MSMKHSVTVYGYRNLANGKYIMLWDSNLNGGAGGVIISTYSISGMTFVSNNCTLTCVDSVLHSNAVLFK